MVGEMRLVAWKASVMGLVRLSLSEVGHRMAAGISPSAMKPTAMFPHLFVVGTKHFISWIAWVQGKGDGSMVDLHENVFSVRDGGNCESLLVARWLRR